MRVVEKLDGHYPAGYGSYYFLENDVNSMTNGVFEAKTLSRGVMQFQYCFQNKRRRTGVDKFARNWLLLRQLCLTVGAKRRSHHPVSSDFPKPSFLGRSVGDRLGGCCRQLLPVT